MISNLTILVFKVRTIVMPAFEIIVKWESGSVGLELRILSDSWGWRMAQRAKSLLCHHENWSSGAQHSCKCQVGEAVFLVSQGTGDRGEDPQNEMDHKTSQISEALGSMRDLASASEVESNQGKYWIRPHVSTGSNICACSPVHTNVNMLPQQHQCMNVHACTSTPIHMYGWTYIHTHRCRKEYHLTPDIYWYMWATIIMSCYDLLFKYLLCHWHVPNTRQDEGCISVSPSALTLSDGCKNLSPPSWGKCYVVSSRELRNRYVGNEKCI